MFVVKNEAGKRLNIELNSAWWLGETGRDFVGPAGGVRRLPWPQNHPFLILLLVCCLPLFGRAIILSRLPCLPLPPFDFLSYPHHHAAFLLFLEARIVSSVGDGRSPPQYRGYQVDPLSSCGGNSLSGPCTSWHRAWGRALRQSLLAKQVVSGMFVCHVFWLLPTLVGYRGVLGGRHFHGTPRGPWR